MRYLISLLISNLLIFQPAFATLNNVDKTQIFSKNLLSNGGFENGKAQWTPNDTADFTTSTTTPLEGAVNAEWDADASTDTLTSTAVTIPSGWYGRNGVASCVFVTPSGTATHEIQAYDGSNVLSEATITSSTSPTRTSTNFIFPSSGSISLRIYANADEPNLEIDSCVIGPAEGYNVSSVSQATFVGSAYYAATAACSWSRTNTSAGAFTADTDCPAPTIISNAGPGTISTTDNNLPQFTVTNLPPGIYDVEINVGIAMGASAVGVLQISDGTTNGNRHGLNAATTTNENVTILGTFTYTTTQSSVTFQVYGLTSSGSITIDGTNYDTIFKIRRFPTSSEQAYTPDLQAMSWSGYHDSTCVWSRTNTAFGDFTADASCALAERTNQNFGTVSASGSVLPAITFTPKKIGRYYVCAIANAISGGTTSNTWALQLIDGASTVVAQATGYTPANGAYQASMCGIYVVTSLSAKTLTIQSKVSSSSIAISGGAVGSSVEWSIFSIDQSLPAPVLTNMVTTSASGGTRENSAEVSCAASASITQNPGSWLSSIGNRSGAACTLTVAAGVFSAAPYACHVTIKTTSVQATACNCTSATACTIYGAAADYSYYVTMVGPR